MGSGNTLFIFTTSVGNTTTDMSIQFSKFLLVNVSSKDRKRLGVAVGIIRRHLAEHSETGTLPENESPTVKSIIGVVEDMDRMRKDLLRVGFKSTLLDQMFLVVGK
jgi:hypothetical protein